MTAAAQWIREHDDRWSFIFFYIGGAIVLSIWLNLFWVAMLMLGHFVLEICRGYLIRADRPMVHALWEVKLDIGLLLFAVAVALYAEHVLAVLGLGQAARAGQAARGVQMAARFGIIERALRVFVLTIDDIARLVQVALKIHANNREPASIPASQESHPASGTAPWSAPAAADVLSLSFGAACLALIVLTPSLTGTSAADVVDHVALELSPYR